MVKTTRTSLRGTKQSPTVQGERVWLLCILGIASYLAMTMVFDGLGISTFPPPQ
jgi:hypothetical protein